MVHEKNLREHHLTERKNMLMKKTLPAVLCAVLLLTGSIGCFTGCQNAPEGYDLSQPSDTWIHVNRRKASKN